MAAPSTSTQAAWAGMEQVHRWGGQSLGSAAIEVEGTKSNRRADRDPDVIETVSNGAIRPKLAPTS